MNPHTGAEVNHPTHAWKYSYDTHQAHVSDGRLWWGATGNLTYPRLKNYLTESEAKGIVPTDLLLADVAGTTDEGTRILQGVFQSNALDFNNPKPIRLIQNLVSIAEGESSDDFIVLDSFAGSGTTAHAVLALNKADGGNRQFILVECEDYADTITAERVRRVINGVPNARDKALQAGLGGSFAYCTLGAPIDPEKMLTGEALPSWSSLAAYLLHTAAGLSVSEELQPQDADGRFYETETTAWHLLYQPEIAWLRSSAAVLTEEQALRIHSSGKAAYVFAADKYIGQRMLTDLNITFCQLPYELHRLGG